MINYGLSGAAFNMALGISVVSGERPETVMTMASSSLARKVDVVRAVTTARQTSALNSNPQIVASWSAANYRHGGLMNGIERIMYRHSYNSGFSNVIRFSEGTSARQIVQYVESALTNGKITESGNGAYSVIHDIGRTIGTDIAGNDTSIISSM